ncbi:MAG: hypothetical protein H6Q72_4194 [Firmicutes bacterium]|nr:hypothetical protein [Bacillota bacterium]
MVDIFNIDKMTLFIFCFVPGFISWKVWQLLVPGEIRKPVDYFLEVMSYGCINFAVVWWVLAYIKKIQPYYPGAFIFLIYVLLLVLPILWPIIIKKVIESERFRNKVILPTPKAWDHFFSSRKACFVLIHLKNGKLVGGLYLSEKSYTSSFPNTEDLYLEEVWRVDNNGAFLNKVEGTYGLWISKENFDYLEFFDTNYEGGEHEQTESVD